MKILYRTIAGAARLLCGRAQYWLVTQGKGGAALSDVEPCTSSASSRSSPTCSWPRRCWLRSWRRTHRVGRFLDRPSVRTAIAGYIVIVGTVYFALLRNLGHATGLRPFFEYVLHYVMPPLFVLDWLLFVPKGEIGWRNGVDSLALSVRSTSPGRWCTAPFAGWYPYPFIDVPELGYGRVLLNIGRAHPRLPGARARCSSRSTGHRAS